MRRRRRHVRGALALAVATGGCATTTPSPPHPVAVPPAVTAPAGDEADEQVGPGDRLVVAIPHLVRLGQTHTMELLVGSTPTLPVIGPVPIVGPTTAHVRADLVRRLREGEVLVDPHVTIVVSERRAPRVTVVGAVESPGRKVLAGERISLSRALALAGGLRVDAADEAWLLGASGRRALDLTRRGLELRAGDVLQVAAASRYTLSGDVARPGEYPLRRRTTLLQALALAGGALPSGALTGVTIRRTTAQGTLTIEVDLEEVRRRARPDVELAGGDVVEVPRGAAAWLVELGCGLLRRLDGRASHE